MITTQKVKKCYKELEILGDHLLYQQDLLNVLRIPLKKRKSYQEKIYKVIENRERVLFERISEISEKNSEIPMGNGVNKADRKRISALFLYEYNGWEFR